MTVAALVRRVKKLEVERGVGATVSVLMEEGARFGYLGSGGTITLEEIERLEQAGRQLVIRYYPAGYLGNI